MNNIMNFMNRRTAKWFLLLCLSAFFSAEISAQDFRIVKGDCLPTGLPETATSQHAGGRHLLPAIRTNWDSTRIYRQLVVLISYSDCDFNQEDANAFYNDMLNTPGFNQRKGPGCLAEYFKEQSRGLFNVQFDVYGPYQVDTKAQPYTNPDENTRNYGRDVFTKAVNLFMQEQETTNGAPFDFSPYDWNGDKNIEQVIFVVAGLCGNAGNNTYGYLWPNTSTMTTIQTADGYKISNYTASAEHWPTTNKASCGFGTIAHEYTHSLGLPDIYPTSSSAGFSVVDEWDLMDGGNFTNYGWCPPNYTPLERMLLGWLEPVELDSSATITGMKTLRDSGEVYRIKHSSSEWYLLENRQQQGWDLGLPGRGLVIYHVNYDKSVWSGNKVNINSNKRRFELVHADNMDYDAWENQFKEMGVTSKYRNSGHMNNYYLSTSAYPLMGEGDTYVNNELTDTSVPAAQMHYPGDNEKDYLSKPITNIRMADDGTISFDFMGGVSTAISTTTANQSLLPVSTFDLSGRVARPGAKGLLIERRQDGSVRKMIK